MKLAEENLWKKFLIIGYGHNLGDLTPKVQVIKGKIDWISLKFSLFFRERKISYDIPYMWNL